VPGEFDLLPEHAPPRSMAELGIPESMLGDLILREAVVSGRTSTVLLAKRLAVSPAVISPMVEELRELRYLEVRGMEGRDYLLAPTDAGRVEAMDRMQHCRYLGPAPVSLPAYVAMVQSQYEPPAFDMPSLREAFSDLVMGDGLLREVGPAAMGKGAMFLYGPPGTGKTSIAQRLLRLYSDAVLIPHCVEVDGQIVSVFDPIVHKPVLGLTIGGLDPRWVLCERPFVLVGGELTRDQLDLSYQSSSGTYVAPLQMQANNGFLVIDDFGRQSLRPEELLNRWIVPLDRHVDYLSLEHGMTFEVPFTAKIVFSTNLEPRTLGDEAFFRRIQSKVLVPPVGDDQFDEILQRVAAARGIELTSDAATHLRWMSRELGDGDLRPYLPGAVCDLLESVCAFEGLPLRLDPAMITRIARMYFTHDPDTEEEPVTSSVGSLIEEAGLGPAPRAGSLFSSPTVATGPDPVAAAAAKEKKKDRLASAAARAMAALEVEEHPTAADQDAAAATPAAREPVAVPPPT
jgi:hypothetical protein